MKREARNVRLVIPDKSRSSRMPLIKPPPGKNVMPTRADEPSDLESAVFGNLDPDKLSDLAEVLFAVSDFEGSRSSVVSAADDASWILAYSALYGQFRFFASAARVPEIFQAPLLFAGLAYLAAVPGRSTSILFHLYYILFCFI